MKILHVIESLEIGGAEMFVINLVNQMPKEYEQSICCIKKIGPLENRLSRDIRVFCLNKKEGNSLSVPFRLAKIIRHGGYDVVHSHNWGVLIESLVGGRLGGARCIIHTAHGIMEHYSKNKIKKHLRKIAERVMAFFLDKLVTVSDQLRGQIISDLSISSKKIMTVYNGVICRDDSKHIIKNNNMVTLVSVGRMVPVKNYQMLIKAFKIAEEKCSIPIRLIFVGDGPERKRLEQIKDDMKLGEKVIFYGYRDDTEKIMCESDIFVNSSFYEGISIAILEAMKESIPVIATSVGGNKEIIEDNFSGLLVPNNDAEKFSKAIVELVNDFEKRKRIGQNSKVIVSNRFNLNKTLDDYARLYNGIVNSR
jgi:sugar transferase (PEP-CTERM/EpsH1 system associated)